MKNIHADIMELIQNHLDIHQPLPRHVEEHLKTCAECRAFKESLEQFTQKLKESLKKEIEELGPLDFSYLQRSSARKRSSFRYIPWVTAGFLCILLSLFFYQEHQTTRRTHSLIWEQNHLFVESLVDGPLFVDEDGLDDLVISTTWFDSHEIVDEFIGSFSLENTSNE